MTHYELMKYTLMGINNKIRDKCGMIADSCVTEKRIAELEALIADYHEIMREFEKAKREED